MSQNRKTPLGIIAGNGKFPLLVAQQAQKAKRPRVICAIEGEAEPSLETHSHAFCWVKIGELKKLTAFFKKHGVEEAVMAGKVEKVRLFQKNVRPDLEMMKILMRLRDHKDDTLLGAIADYLSGQGILLQDSTALIADAIPGAGVLGRIKPSREVSEDISFGFRMAKAIAGLDIGQTVVVKKKAVIAVEAIEGTDLAIQRAGELVSGKVTVVKVAKPNQDKRFDVPAVGMKTLQQLIAAQACAFAFEAGQTLFLDQEVFVREADRHKIAVVGMDADLIKGLDRPL